MNYWFDDFHVDTHAFRLERHGMVVPLEPKAFDLLVLLLASGDRVVASSEILETLWKDTAVTDDALTRIVAQLRGALEDEAREAKYIETVPTRGYRWIGGTTRATTAAPVTAATLVRRRWFQLALAASVVLLSVMVARFGVRSETPPPAAITASRSASQLTTSPGLDVFPAVSPDGQSVAYSSDASGAFEIIVRSFAAGAAPVVVTRDGHQNIEPAWSPDGRSLAYHSMSRGGVWVVPAAGGVTRQLSTFGSQPSWSPSGDAIAFQSDEPSDLAPQAFGANERSTIWIVKPDGSGARSITRPGDPQGGHASPVWLSGGRRLVFASHTIGRSALWSMRVDGSDLVRLTDPGVSLFDPTVAPDGHAVYGTTGASIIRLPIDPDTGRRAGPATTALVASIPNARYISAGRDGRLVVSGLSLRTNLWSVSAADGERASEPRALTNETPERKAMPSFSPDGRRIAFAGGRTGAGSDIWIMDADGGNLQPLIGGPGNSDGPGSNDERRPAYLAVTWFPDARRLGFMKNQHDAQLFATVDLESRRETTMFALSDQGFTVEGSMPRVRPDLRLSPDGTRIAYSHARASTGRSRVFIRPAAGGDALAATSGEFSESFPAWSPDGRWIAFQIAYDGSSQIAVVPASGGVLRQFTSNRGESWVHDWSPDSDKIVFASFRGGVWNIRWVSLRTGQERQVTHYASPNTFVRYPAWSPNGAQIVYEFGELKGNLWTTAPLR